MRALNVPLLSRLAERRLLTRFRARDRAAFDMLFARHGPQVFGFSLHLTGCRSDAEDLTQETFLAAFQGAHTFDQRARLSTWLISIAARRWRDISRTRRAVTVALWDDQDADDDTNFRARLISPLRTEQAALTNIAYRRALASLDPPLREAWLLVGAEGFTHREAALALEAPEGTIKWRVAQAAKKLRHALSEEEVTP